MLPYGCDGYLSTYGRFFLEIAFKYWNSIQNTAYFELNRVFVSCEEII